jgi:hypothetical protein
MGFQLSMYRLLDDLEEARRIRDVSIESQNAAMMIARYNELVERFNKLATAANQLADYGRSLERGTQDRDARIAELERQLADSRQEVKFLRDAAHDRFCAEMDLLKEKEQQSGLHSQQT